jgi:hypothetical protein
MSRALAAAVLTQALQDATDTRLAAPKRAEVRQWFDSPAAAMWCELAGLNPSAVRRALRDRLG